MPYRLKRKESVADGVRRVAREEAEKALATATGGGPVSERVHDSRTGCKKLRGLLRLVRPHLGDVYRRENLFLRDAARDLSAARDAAVVLDVFDELARSYSEHRASLTALRPALAERIAVSDGGMNDAVRLTVFAEAMREFLGRMDSWCLDARGFRAVGDGLVETYRRGRDAMHEAFDGGRAADWHEWRKQAKYHWYHVRLLRNAWKPAMEARTDELDRLSDLLGDDHDLAVLRATAADFAGADPLLDLVDRRREELQTAARPLGERLYAEKPKAFGKRVRRYWKVWRRE